MIDSLPLFTDRQLFGAVLGALVSVSAFAFRSLKSEFDNRIAGLKVELAAHITTCDQMPKAQILTAITGLGEQMRVNSDGLQRQITQVDRSYHEFKNLLTAHWLSGGSGKSKE